MASPKKTLLVEEISYAEEALKNLKVQLKELFEDIELEYSKVLDELRKMEENEVNVDEQTFDRVNRILQNAWVKAMSARTRLKELDEDLHEVDTIMSNSLTKLQNRRSQFRSM